jgi:hypothetical protein
MGVTQIDEGELEFHHIIEIKLVCGSWLLVMIVAIDCFGEILGTNTFVHTLINF